MKIVHLCTGYPISFNGGITNYVRTLAETQSKKGQDVVVIGAPELEKKEYKFKYVEYNDFFIRPFTLKERKSITSYTKIEKILKKELPDLLHIHMMLDVDIRLFEILKKLNIKYVISLHDYSFICPRIQMFTDGKPCQNIGENCTRCATLLEQGFITKKICNILKINKENGKKYSPNFIKMYEENKKLLEGAELLLPVSNRVKEIYQKSNIKNEYKVLHIGNITADNFKPYKAKKIKEKTEIKILMLGNFSLKKGGDEFIKIANSLKNENYKFYFLGRATEEEKEKMKKNNIINKGKYKQSELSKILKEYDFGCVLSIWEDNAPQVVMELLNNNIPVIGTRMGGIPDFIKDGENGFLYDPYDKVSLETLIEKLKQITKEKCEDMKSKIQRTKTPDEHFKELEREYNKIINK